ncbi:helix-turn-helix transcriptional regulator [Sphingomonas sp. OTU376]|uniref:helix-turn-helix transcriptional regulator n=1 Tax=Sphingomonas sp. OTU376 TaxID=3043863 RepID=UPI00313AA0F9
MNTSIDPREQVVGRGNGSLAPRRHLRNQEAAALIGISPTTLKIWRVKGKGPTFIKLGDSKQATVIYVEEDVLAWLSRHRFRSTSAYSARATGRHQLED